MDMAELRVTAVDQASAVLAKIKGSADEASKSGENLKSVWNGGMMDGFTKGPALAAIGVIGALSAALMPTVTDTVTATSSASGAVTVQLPRKYITVTGVQITSLSSTQANPSYSNLVLSETVLASNTLDLHCYDASNARVAVSCSIQITGVAAL